MASTVGQLSILRDQTNGILPVTASQTAGNVSKISANKSSGPRLKIVVRRLAPGLTEAEFIKLLGDDWKLGQGRVDWFSYKLGKDSKDLSKPSRPSRAYLHLTSDVHVLSLSETVRRTSFEDAQSTWNSPALLGPPVVEFAPYTRIPSGRRRTDARQGTIDQDPEFMDFLESLANPVSSKEPVEDGDMEVATPKGEITITPLVQFLKDKKANKGKEVAASKAAKHARQESASRVPAKTLKDASASLDDTKKTPKDIKKERLVEKASREAVKVLTREAATKISVAQESPKNPRAQARERGSIAAAARILQRDLGLSPVHAHRKAKADADNASKAETSTQSSTTSTPSKPPAGPANKGRGGRPENEKPQTTAKEVPATITLLKKPTDTAPTTSPILASAPSTDPPTAPAAMPKAQLARKPQVVVPSTGATRAFVKHANPSQGVTEPLLKVAMEVFGAVSYVEIDKRKGFAYVDFVEPEGLVKAIAANPIKIAQGTVQVLERKDPKPAIKEPPAGPSRGGFQGRGRGTIGRRGGRGGGPSPSPATSAAPATAPTGPAADVK